MNNSLKNIIFTTLFFGVLITLLGVFHFRIDLTEDRRHSLHRSSKELMQKLEEPLYVDFYLNGKLNPGFTRLKSGSVELLEELSAKSRYKIHINYINPDNAGSSAARVEQQKLLEERGLTPTLVYEKDKEGNVIQRTLFPWIEIRYKEKSSALNLLKNLPALTGEENLNISIENLEYEITDAIHRLSNTKVEKIAFLEGQGELSEAETFDISRTLSRYFQIDRGVIGHDARILGNYRVVIVAQPTEPFSEEVKFTLDQYLMHGGSILWLMDPVQISEEMLSSRGETPAVALDLNLDDLFFRYGVRMPAALIQDVQSLMLPLNVAGAEEQAEFMSFPFVYSPLLLTSENHPVTKNITPVLSRFASPVELTGASENLNPSILLASSSRSGILQTPAVVSLSELPDLNDSELFGLSYIPTAVLLEGQFSSVFTHRMVPPGIENYRERRDQSVPARQIFIADGDIIRNELSRNGDSIEAMPLGLDRYSGMVYGNSEFIVNSVLYLGGKHERIELRSRTLPLRLLRKDISKQERIKLQIINIALPAVLLLIAGMIYQWLRKRKYSR